VETGKDFHMMACLLVAVLIVSGGYAYAQFRQDFFGGVR
jgi:hypothetical protein